MRLPTACIDDGLLLDEPFQTEFLVCANIVGRQGASKLQSQRLSVVATQYLREVPNGAGVRIFFPVSYMFLERLIFRFLQPISGLNWLSLNTVRMIRSVN